MDNKSSATGVSFAGVLTVAFIALKLSGIISWSWIWVLSPIWGSAIIAILMVIWLIVFF